MKRPKIDFRYRKAAKAIAERFDTNPPPECRIGRGRITLRFRQTGDASWPEPERIDYAFRVASFVRGILAEDTRRALRRRASRAVVVIYEDMMIASGCDIDIRWACVVPASTDQRR
jgi:hypothetical protein